MLAGRQQADQSGQNTLNYLPNGNLSGVLDRFEVLLPCLNMQTVQMCSDDVYNKTKPAFLVSKPMTQALKIEDNDLDIFVTSLLKDHVDPSVHRLIWKTYRHSISVHGLKFSEALNKMVYPMNFFDSFHNYTFIDSHI